MKKKIRSTAFIALLLLAVVLTATAVKPQSSSAYFTAYDEAKGSKTLNYIYKTEIHEDPNGLTKEVSVENSGTAAVFARVKVLAGDQIGLSFSGDGWSMGTDGYLYYAEPVAPDASTGKLVINISPAEGFDSDFNVVVAEETVPAFYDVNGTAYADWNAEVIEG